MSSDLDAKPNAKELYSDMGPAAKTAAETPRIIPKFVTQPKPPPPQPEDSARKSSNLVKLDELPETTRSRLQTSTRPAGQHFDMEDVGKHRAAHVKDTHPA